VGVVAAGDHHEVRPVDVGVPLQAVIGVPQDLAFAADDGDETLSRTSVGVGIIDSVYLSHPEASLWRGG
jgi:hypothetical protein